MLGTQNLVEAALECGTGRFAAHLHGQGGRPRSILGATKRLAEMIVQAHADGKMQRLLSPVRQCAWQPRLAA